MTSFWLCVLLLSVTEVVIGGENEVVTVCSYYSNCTFADLQDLDKQESIFALLITINWCR